MSIKIKKPKKENVIERLLKIAFSRMFLVGIVITLQVLFFIFILMFWSHSATFIYLMFTLVSVIITIWIFQSEQNPSYKLAWALVLIVVPQLGGIFYLIWGKGNSTKKIKAKLDLIEDRSNHLTTPNFSKINEVFKEYPALNRQASLVANMGNAPIFTNTSAKYYPLGELQFKDMIDDLKTAKDFILLEYFIVEEGQLWNDILAVLKEKALSGVEVYFMYDDVGCVGTLPQKYYETMRTYGIKCHRFNPLRPQIYTFMNHRDHRKICVIDGKIGYMGGTNLADEYINQRLRFGHWKDTAVKIQGDAVYRYTVMFFQMWEFTSDTTVDYQRYFVDCPQPSNGIIQPYGDQPLDDINTIESSYINIINLAKKYVYIATPYLILDHEMIIALQIAARAGVDVRIVTPNIPDKWYAFYVTQSYYQILMNAGVKIYQYTPGFIHAKMFVSDDHVAIVGTANMDYRSLFLHFECCTAFYNSSIVTDVKNDMDETIEKSQRIDFAYLDNIPFFKWIVQSILRIFAPLM